MKEQNKVKHLDETKSYFEANGKKYHITKDLCIARWRHFEDLQALVGHGRTFDDINIAFRDIWKFLDEQGGAKTASAAIICHNAMTGIMTKLEERHHPLLMICTLFANYEGEDEKIFDEEIMKSKINDWQEEGYDVSDFFRLGFKLVPSFIEVYKEDIVNTLNLTKQEQSSQSKDNK